jgi:hypothetical protein
MTRGHRRPHDELIVRAFTARAEPHRHGDVDTIAGGSANGSSVGASGTRDGANTRSGSSGRGVAMGGIFSSVESGSASGCALCEYECCGSAGRDRAVSSLNSVCC